LLVSGWVKMGSPRLSVIIISLLAIGLFSVGFMGFYGQGSVDYGITTYDNSTFDYLEDISGDMSDSAISTKNETEGLGSSIDSENDVFGSFFAQAWTALKTTGQSLDATQDLVSDSADKIPFMNSKFVISLKTFIISAAIIIIIIGIFLHFVKQSDRL